MARRKKQKLNTLSKIIVFLLVLLIIFLIYKIVTANLDISTNKDSGNSIEEKSNNKVKDDKKEAEEKKEETKEINNSETNTKSNNVTDKSNNDENIETNNEVIRKGGSVKIELIGEEEIIIDKGTKYKDAGFKAIYSDGSDASSEVEVDNTVDTSKEGIYTVSYYAGNSVVIRRVIVK